MGGKWTHTNSFNRQNNSHTEWGTKIGIESELEKDTGEKVRVIQVHSKISLREKS